MKLPSPCIAAATTCFSADWFSAIFCAALFTSTSASAVVAQTGTELLNPAEKWVLKKIKAGERADLSTEFREEKDRTLSARFLEDLLTGAALHRHGVRIEWASVTEPIDLENAQIPCEVRLDNCHFYKEVSFAHANIMGGLSFSRSTFGAVHSRGIKVGGDAVFDFALFKGHADFTEADIAGEFHAQTVTVQGGGDFSRMKVRGGWIRLDGARFERSPVYFNYVETVGDFVLQNAKCIGDKMISAFQTMKIGGNAQFSGTVFEGFVSLMGAEIAGDFVANAKFRDTVNFTKLRVGGDFLVSSFEGRVDFTGADIRGNFGAQSAKFQGKYNQISFHGTKVGRAALFSDASFEGSVRFAATDVGGNFEAERAKFRQGADFWGMKVGGDGNIADAVFEGMAQFSRVNIASDFEATGTKFENRETGADFFGMKIGGNAVLTGAVFEGPARFDAAEVAGSLKLGASFQDRASFQRMKVLGSASFYHAIFEDAADFRYADFGSLLLWPVSWPKQTPHSHMQGMNYKYFQAAAEEPKSHKELLKLADQSSYTADVYSTLEDFFRRQGYRADADKAFIAGKVRERREYFGSGDWFGWLGSWMLDLLVGYGRQPWRAGISCAVLVALGCVLFSPKKMEPQSPEDTPRVYNRFWYSLGLFLPFVDLQSNKVWKPKADRTFLRNYMRVHILLGWILVPLVLAAVTGLIK